MKKLMLYTMTMNYGGTERVISNLANHFSSEYEVVIVTNIRDRWAFKLNKNIKKIKLDDSNKKDEFILKKLITKFSLKRSKKLKKVIEEEKPDLIISFLPEPSIRMLSMKKYFDIPMYVAVRNNPKNEFNLFIFKIIRRIYYKKADVIIVQNENFIKYFQYSKKVIMIENMLEEKEKIICDKKDIIINVGRLVKQKNQISLIKAFKLVHDKYPNYKLHIYGEGKLEKKLLNVIKKNDLNESVKIINNTNDIIKKIASSKVFVLSSLYEGMPNSLIEAISVGTTPVSTDSSPSIKELIKDEKYISKINDSNDLAEKIIYAINHQKKIKYKIDNEKIYAKWDKIIEDKI